MLLLALSLIGFGYGFAANSPITLNFTSDNLYDIVADAEHGKYAEIRKSVMNNNPFLTFFDISRDVDFITLSFRLGQGPEKAEFRLMGDKHLLYRVAMGRDLQKNIEKLAAGDPKVVRAEGAKKNGIISINVYYYGGDAKQPVVVVDPKPPAPVQPEKKEEEQQLPEVSKPPSVKASEKEAYAKAVEAGQEEALLKFVEKHPDSEYVEDAKKRTKLLQEASDYELAKKLGTEAAYLAFVEKYPNSEYARRINLLREEKAYDQAREQNSEAAYLAFMEKFPESSHRSEIEEKIKDFRKAQPDEAKNDKRRVEAYNQARKSNTVGAYKLFLTVYPDAPETKEIQKKIKEIEEEDSAFEAARDSEKRLIDFLGKYPKGNHAEEAESLLQKLKAARMEKDYSRAVEVGSIAALEKFLDKWPKGPKTSSVRAAIKKLRTPPKPPEDEKKPDRRQPEESTGGAIADLLAKKVETPPRIDGVADDKSWRQARAVTVSVAGPKTKTGQVTLRALHDGRFFYLLAEWEDVSRDTLFRPWIWDPAKKTYHQNEQADDAFAVNFYIDKFPSSSCMLNGEEFEADLWMWRAFWSEISGLAYDRIIKASHTRIPKSNPYPIEEGDGQIWIREEADAGKGAWRFFVPVGSFEGAVLPSYHQQNPEGSLGDVKARGAWNSRNGSGVWTVEMSRLLNTQNSDDIVLEPGKEIAIAIATYDKAEKEAHSTSRIIRLILK